MHQCACGGRQDLLLGAWGGLGVWGADKYVRNELQLQRDVLKVISQVVRGGKDGWWHIIDKHFSSGNMNLQNQRSEKLAANQSGISKM